jgi:hypothetical protein
MEEYPCYSSLLIHRTMLIKGVKSVFIIKPQTYMVFKEREFESILFYFIALSSNKSK